MQKMYEAEMAEAETALKEASERIIEMGRQVNSLEKNFDQAIGRKRPSPSGDDADRLRESLLELIGSIRAAMADTVLLENKADALRDEAISLVESFSSPGGWLTAGFGEAAGEKLNNKNESLISFYLDRVAGAAYDQLIERSDLVLKRVKEYVAECKREISRYRGMILELEED